MSTLVQTATNPLLDQQHLTTFPFEHHHEDLVQDAQYDASGRRLATCSLDGTVRLWQVDPSGTVSFLLSLQIPEETVPLMRVAWAPEKLGPVLAVAGHDGRVTIWKEVRPQQWLIAKTHKFSSTGKNVFYLVNALAWRPTTTPPQLLVACSDGHVHAFEVEGQGWKLLEPIEPLSSTTSLLSLAFDAEGRILATGASDALIRLYDASSNTENLPFIATLQGHADWVRDLAWHPKKSLLASCSQDCRVLFWFREASSNDLSAWQLSASLTDEPFGETLWRVSWSKPGGELLAVSGGDGKVTLWGEEESTGEWKCLTSLPNQQQ